MLSILSSVKCESRPQWYVSKKRHINPYKQDVFVNQKYYKDAMARADI